MSDDRLLQIEVIHPNGFVEPIDSAKIDMIKGIVSIGRHAANDIVLTGQGVEDFHALLDYRDPEQFQLLYLNQNLLNKEQLPTDAASIPEVVGDNQTLSLLNYLLVLRTNKQIPITPPSEAPADSSTTDSAPLPASADIYLGHSRANRPELAVVSNIQAGAQRPIHLEIDEHTQQVNVEQTATWTLTIANRGDRTARFQVTLEAKDRDSAWHNVQLDDEGEADRLQPQLPLRFELNNKSSRSVTLTLTPPRRTDIRAGWYYLRFKVVADDYPGQERHAELALRIRPFGAFRIDKPTPSRFNLGFRKNYAFRNRLILPVSSNSNRLLALQVTGQEVENRCRIEFGEWPNPDMAHHVGNQIAAYNSHRAWQKSVLSKAQFQEASIGSKNIEVSSEAEEWVPVRVIPHRRYWFGGAPRIYQLEFSLIQENIQEQAYDQVTVEHKALIRPWMVWMSLALTIAFVLLLPLMVVLWYQPEVKAEVQDRNDIVLHDLHKKYTPGESITFAISPSYYAGKIEISSTITSSTSLIARRLITTNIEPFTVVVPLLSESSTITIEGKASNVGIDLPIVQYYPQIIQNWIPDSWREAPVVGLPYTLTIDNFPVATIITSSDSILDQMFSFHITPTLAQTSSVSINRYVKIDDKEEIQLEKEPEKIQLDAGTSMKYIEWPDEFYYPAKSILRVEVKSWENVTVTSNLNTSVTLNDDQHKPQIRVMNVSAFEPGPNGETSITFPVTLTSKPLIALPISYQINEGTAEPNVDYVVQTTDMITFSPRSELQTVTVELLHNETAVEKERNFELVLLCKDEFFICDGLTLAATGTITDIDGTPQIYISDATANENSREMRFTVKMERVLERDVSMTFSVIADTAQEGKDYRSPLPGQNVVTIPSGQDNATIVIPLIQDNINEPDEKFTVKLMLAQPGDGSMVTLDPDTATGTIHDTTEPLLSIRDSSAAESAGFIEFEVTLAPASSQDITFNFATQDSMAKAGSDYDAISGNATIRAGETSTKIRVSLITDNLAEPDEGFSVNLSNATGGAIIDDGQAIGTITEAQGLPTLSISDETGSENVGRLFFVVELSRRSALPVTVSFETSDGKAKAGQDYTSVSDSVTIPAGQLTAEISVSILPDADSEEEDFFVNLSNPINASISDRQGKGTIFDNDAELTIGQSAAPQCIRFGPTENIVYTIAITNTSNATGTIDKLTSTLSKVTDEPSKFSLRVVSAGNSNISCTYDNGNDTIVVTCNNVTIPPGKSRQIPITINLNTSTEDLTYNAGVTNKIEVTDGLNTSSSMPDEVESRGTAILPPYATPEAPDSSTKIDDCTTPPPTSGE